jgi:hypothetical protein
MPKVLVHTWSGDGRLTVGEMDYPVSYELRYEGNSNMSSTVGHLRGLPASLLDQLPQDDRLPLTLANGDTVGVAIFGGQPCRVRVNGAMPGLD